MRYDWELIIEIFVGLVAAIVLAVMLSGCATIEQAVELYDQHQSQPEPTPEPDPIPESEPEPINYGGDGLYKPESDLWLLPTRHPNGNPMRVSMLGVAGEYRDASGQHLVKHLRVGHRQGPLSSGGPYSVDESISYHNNRLKLRGAKATASGNWLLAWGSQGNLIYRKQIIDRDVRQE